MPALNSFIQHLFIGHLLMSDSRCWAYSSEANKGLVLRELTI